MKLLWPEHSDRIFLWDICRKLMNLLGDLAYRKFFIQTDYKMELAEYTILDFLMNRLVSSVLYYNTDSEQDSLDSRMVSFISDNYKTATGCSHREKAGQRNYISACFW